MQQVLSTHLAELLKSLEHLPSPIPVDGVICDAVQHADGLHCLRPQDVIAHALLQGAR